MLDNLNKLDLTAKDIELIEAALHTQKKILSVQSQAGRTGASHKLTELKHLMKRIGRARPSTGAQNCSVIARAFRSLLRSDGGCGQMN